MASAAQEAVGPTRAAGSAQAACRGCRGTRLRSTMYEYLTLLMLLRKNKIEKKMKKAETFGANA